MELVGIWRYPVKSLQGEPLDSARLERDGLLGDRRWGIRNQHTGRILTARRRPELLDATAWYDGPAPRITLPDGRHAHGPGRDTDRTLSEWLGGPVTLVASASSDPGRAEFFADATDDTSQAIEWTMPESRYVDAAPLLVLTTSSLRAGEALHPDGVWDPRRFRPNLVIDLEDEGWVEDEWIGRPLRVGTAALLVPTERCIRCTMVTRPQPGLEADVDVFRTLARHHGARFGVWTEVLTAGSLAVGDAAALPPTDTGTTPFVS
jgi:MOSC domain-containing protein